MLNHRVFSLSLVILLAMCLSPQPQPVARATGLASPLQQTAAPFLISPYYGSHSINSFFDHEYPTYGANANGTIVIYTGERRGPPASSTNCTLGFSCYDGHDGYDFNLSYESVLAAAGGTVDTIGWEVNNCHDPVQNPNVNCKFGLRIIIDHGNGYRTLYGHLSAAGVQQGQQVTARQIIGASGNTGNSTGAHLHSSVLYNVTTPVDPFGWSGGGPDPWQQASGVTSNFLWGAGQWANPSNPVAAPPSTFTITLDDCSSSCSTGFSKGDQFGDCDFLGDCRYWNFASGVGQGNEMWWVNINNLTGSYYAQWQPSFPVSAFYKVQVFIPNNNATSWQAHYLVYNAGGGFIQTTVDQLGTENHWLSLGTYRFDAGSSAADKVFISANTGDIYATPPRQLGVDAVRFIARPQVFIPIAIKP